MDPGTCCRGLFFSAQPSHGTFSLFLSFFSSRLPPSLFADLEKNVAHTSYTIFIRPMSSASSWQAGVASRACPSLSGRTKDDDTPIFPSSFRQTRKPRTHSCIASIRRTGKLHRQRHPFRARFDFFFVSHSLNAIACLLLVASLLCALCFLDLDTLVVPDVLSKLPFLPRNHAAAACETISCSSTGKFRCKAVCSPRLCVFHRKPSSVFTDGK